MLKHTKIIATCGPSTDEPQIIESLIEEGVNIFRLNFSHGSHEEHLGRIKLIKDAREKLNSNVAILLDTKGPEIRTGLLDGGTLGIDEGDEVILYPSGEPGSGNRVPHTYAALARYLEPGATILLDDGLIELKVIGIDGDDIVCEAMNPGILGQRKSINIPEISVPMPALSDKDMEDILFGIDNGIDFIAASFVRDAQSVKDIKSFIANNDARDIAVIAKIENKDAVENIDEIIKVSDGIMVARGDLGVELPPHEVPHLQKSIIAKCNRSHKPVITATQMLDSMTHNPRPTRAEAADVANAIYDGTDCVMLSGETAAGKYPVETVRTMVDIIQTTEIYYFKTRNANRVVYDEEPTVSQAVGLAAVQTAKALNAKCLVCPTMTGRTARLMSSLRPSIPIYSVTPHARVCRMMQIFWGVEPMLGDVVGSMRQVISVARDEVFSRGFLEVGDVAIFTCGDRFTSPVKRNADGRVEKFAPTNVMYVVQIRSKEISDALAEAGDDALMTTHFFDRV